MDEDVKAMLQTYDGSEQELMAGLLDMEDEVDEEDREDLQESKV